MSTVTETPEHREGATAGARTLVLQLRANRVLAHPTQVARLANDESEKAYPGKVLQTRSAAYAIGFYRGYMAAHEELVAR